MKKVKSNIKSEISHYMLVNRKTLEILNSFSLDYDWLYFNNFKAIQNKELKIVKTKVYH
tara:strand:+ start:1799 stop:1975 length:177 start_codon:yes stop_codon:yes gene_type:complete